MRKRCGMGAEETRALVKERVRVLRSHVAAARGANVDGIHDLRVASRRLRAVLGENASIFSERELDAFREHVVHITRALGRARELDVCLELLDDLAQNTNHVPRPAAEYAANRIRLLRQAEEPNVRQAAGLVESAAFNQALVALFESVSPDSQCYVREAQKRLKKRFRSLAKLEAKWRAQPCEERLHRLRIGFKKLRYGCETFAGLYGAKMKPFLNQLKSAQEALGQWNDYRILRGYIQALSPAVELEPPARDDAPPAGLPRLCAAVNAKATLFLKEFRASSAQFFAPKRAKDIETLLEKTRRACCEFTS